MQRRETRPVEGDQVAGGGCLPHVAMSQERSVFFVGRRSYIKEIFMVQAELNMCVLCVFEVELK
jgi:hypothetical protein